MPRKITLFIVGCLFCSCAMAGIFSSDDPYQKLTDAFNLLGTRPIPRALPAEKLIKEAISDFEKQKDYYGIGTAQFMYGQFVQSEHFDWPQFRKQYPGTETREQRNILAVSYYADAAKNFHIAASDPQLSHDKRTGYYSREYLAHAAMRNSIGACEALRNMKKEHEAFLKEKPDAKVYVEAPYKTFDEFITGSMREAQCKDL